MLTAFGTINRVQGCVFLVIRGPQGLQYEGDSP
jgi:hypothetical protein